MAKCQCNGWRKVRCTRCNGSGTLAIGSDAYGSNRYGTKGMLNTCPDCGGTGEKPCPDCNRYGTK
jgi:hypothetical protein